jgi:hypothetical protein
MMLVELSANRSASIVTAILVRFASTKYRLAPTRAYNIAKASEADETY